MEVADWLGERIIRAIDNSLFRLYSDARRLYEGGWQMKRLSLFLEILIIISLVFTVSCVTKEVPVTETYYDTEYKTETYNEVENVVVKTLEGKEYLNPVDKWQTNLYFLPGGASPGQLAFPLVYELTYYYGYEITTAEHSRIRVEINVSSTALQQEGEIRVIDLAGVGQIPRKPEPPMNKFISETWGKKWLDDLNVVVTNPERILGALHTGNETQNQIMFDAAGVTSFAIFANTWNAYAIKSVKLIWSDDTIEQKTITRERQVLVQVEKQRTVMTTEKVPFWEAVFGD